MTVRVFDDIISQEQHKAVYDWSQSVVWYTKPRFVNTNEYIPSEQGKTQYRHIHKIPSAEKISVAKVKEIFEWAMYRHPIAWRNAIP